MYCSLRFFVDQTPDLAKAQNILRIFEVAKSVLEIPFDYISYTLFDPDKDDLLIHEKYSYNTQEIAAFLDADILPTYLGKSGDFSAPFISATCNGKATQIYARIRVETQFPAYTQPFIIRVDYEQKNAPKLTLEKYVFLIQALSTMGFRINNCFYHVYTKKNEATTLDGGQVGSFTNYYERNNLQKFVLHHGEGCLNRFMDIYCFNSVRLDLLKPETIRAITDIVGDSNLTITDGVLSFALGSVDELSPNYRLTHHHTLRKLQKLLL